MNALFRAANLVGQLLAARRPEWTQIPLRSDGAAVPSSVKTAPTSATAGVHMANSPKTRVLVDLREDVARYGTRVRVTTVDDSATYTVTVDGLEYDYAASGGDGKQEIIEGLADAINDGVSLGSIDCAFADANPDTVTRSAGDWTAQNVGVDTQLIFEADGKSNDDLIVTVASLTATVVTCIATDEVTAEAATAYTVTARQQITAVAEERSDGWTLVIHTRHHEDQTDVLALTDDDDAAKELLADESTTQTVSVSSTGTGALEYDQDATTCDLKVYMTARGKNPPVGWRSPRNLQFDGLSYIGFDERLTTGGAGRVDLAIESADGIVHQAYVGPAIEEGA